ATGCRSRFDSSAAPAPGAATTACRPLETTLDAARRLALVPTKDQGFVDRRIAALVTLARKNPRRIDAWVALGQSSVEKARTAGDPGYYLNANACADLALDLSPGDPLALDLRGLVLLNDHKFEEARALARSMLEKTPDNPLAWGTLSDALLELGDLEKGDEA